MRRAIVTSLVLLGLQQGLLVVPRADAARAQFAAVRSRITVTLPHQDAELLVNDTPAIAAATSVIRIFESAPLESGKVYTYKFTVTWSPNTYTVITRNATVRFKGGEEVAVDLTKDDPTDRARIRYVPTPDTIVDEMIALARVSKDDVVFEPGCGDARITIAAVKAGAKRGVGIDIDPERVSESKQNVLAAGLGKQVDIRLGDALDIRDLSDATVVFMYMGDEFGRLMRPVLVRQLKVGTRIVSHRFTLGDWQPDETITVIDLGIPFLLHKWTVTQEIKDQAAAKSSGRP